MESSHKTNCLEGNNRCGIEAQLLHNCVQALVVVKENGKGKGLFYAYFISYNQPAKSAAKLTTIFAGWLDRQWFEAQIARIC